MNKCHTNIFIHITLADSLLLRKYSGDTAHVKNLSKMPKCEIFEKIQVRLTTLQIFIGFSLRKIVFDVILHFSDYLG